MPAAHALGARLWRTSAVLEATMDKKTPPNSSPETTIREKLCVSAGNITAKPNKAFKRAMAPPP